MQAWSSLEVADRLRLILESISKSSAALTNHSASTDLRLNELTGMIIKLGEVRGIEPETMRQINYISNTIEHHHRQHDGTRICSGLPYCLLNATHRCHTQRIFSHAGLNRIAGTRAAPNPADVPEDKMPVDVQRALDSWGRIENGAGVVKV